MLKKKVTPILVIATILSDKIMRLTFNNEVKKSWV